MIISWDIPIEKFEDKEKEPNIELYYGLEVQEIAWDIYFEALRGLRWLNLYHQGGGEITHSMALKIDKDAVKSVSIFDISAGGAIEDLSDQHGNFDICLIIDRLEAILQTISLT